MYIQNESFETFAVQASVIDEAGDIADFEMLSAIMTRVMFAEPLKRQITGMYAVYVNQHVRYFMWTGNDLYMSDMDTYNAFQPVTSFAGNIHDMTHVEIRNGNQPGQPSDADDIMYIVYGEGRTATNPLLGDFTYSYDFLKFNFESSISRRWRDVNFPFSGAVRYVEALSSSLLAMDGSGAVYSIPLDQVSKYIGNMASFNVIFSHNRIYTDIKKHGEEIYLKYTTPRRYEVARINIDGEQYGMNGSLSSFTSYSSNTIFNLSCEPVEDSQDWVDGYQKIESIRSVNRFRLAQHKSNAYSIEINDSGINSAEFDTPEEREMLKSDIENNIRDIVKTIAPANTQFLNVKWSGK